jgi:hypothetical protein
VAQGPELRRVICGALPPEYQHRVAAPLEVFEGVVSEFIPIVGTYIAGAEPIGVAFLVSPVAGIACRRVPWWPQS